MPAIVKCPFERTDAANGWKHVSSFVRGEPINQGHCDRMAASACAACQPATGCSVFGVGLRLVSAPPPPPLVLPSRQCCFTTPLSARVSLITLTVYVCHVRSCCQPVVLSVRMFEELSQAWVVT